MFQHKLVAVMNEKIEMGKLMNALAHMCIGFGAYVGREKLRLTDYQDADGNSHPHISEIPFMILEANSNKIRTLRQQAIQEGIDFVDFTHTMTEGGFAEQLKRSKETKEGDLIYSGIVLFGDWDKVTQLTRKFSLLK
ncbi:MAG TPA: DUF2000 domain-containing protein [Chlamydiales bacterium]|nr:DUF2000 domain-containing protein [Chlamydiales bacterium]